MKKMKWNLDDEEKEKEEEGNEEDKAYDKKTRQFMDEKLN